MPQKSMGEEAQEALVSAQPIMFIDTLQEANIAHGVARLCMGQVSSGGKIVPAGTVMVPLHQLPVLANALNSLVRQLEERARQMPGIAAALESEEQVVDQKF